MSTKTGEAPAISIAATVATAVCETVATRSPRPIPKERRASAIASVPLATPPAAGKLNSLANSCSKASPSLPRMYQPLSTTRAMAAITSSRCSSKNAPGDICGIFCKGRKTSNIVAQAIPKVGYATRKSFLQSYFGSPPCRLAETPVIGKIIADINAHAFRGKVFGLKTSCACDCDQGLRELSQRDGRTAADVENATLGSRAGARYEEGLHRIFHIGEVTLLLTTPYLEDTSFDHPAQPDSKKSLACILYSHPRPKGVGKAQRNSLQPVNLMVQGVIGLCGRLVNAIDVDRPYRMTLVDRTGHWPSVDLAGRREYDSGLWNISPTPFEQDNLGVHIRTHVG